MIYIMPGKWHNAMENLFPKEMQEIKFLCSSKQSNVSRKADILLNKKRTLEIQHSYISEKEIIDRCNDWSEFGKEIIWIVDGNEGIILDELSSKNTLITFKDHWKYKSFEKTYKFILLERDGRIFKIELDKIKSGMIELKESKSLRETIEFLKQKPDNIWELWGDDNVVKSTLAVYQQGAGNGKTYGIWKSIAENPDKKTYIIVTKQHSAKTVIYEELQDQKKRFENGEEVYHIENIQDDTEENTEKHYVIKYTHKKSKRQCVVIIGTIDSFCYNLSNSNAKGADFFQGIINNIKDNGATKLNNGYMKYGGQHIQLCKECEIWIDEVQDLPENYLHAMCKLMYETSCYINVVGDKLQTLEFNNNFLTTIVREGLPNINIDVKENVNINRRIKVTNMENRINEIIHFNEYGLPTIECDPEIQKETNNEPIKIIESPVIYANDTDEKKVANYCDKIMCEYIQEVESNNYVPNDFLIIFPIMAKNIIAAELETKIQEYWTKIYNCKYTRYVYIHKHTEGTVINTNDSVKATRIMSIKSSKGDGRKVVFVLNITEQSLKLVSNNEKGLIYESQLHVALTRAKQQIYFGLTKNNDDIHKRFGECGFAEYMPKIEQKITIDKIHQLINKQKLIGLINIHITQENVLKQDVKINQSEIVDWGYHCIKYQTYYYNVILNILDNKKENQSKQKSQLFVVLDIISKLNIIEYKVSEFWELLRQYNKPLENLHVIPLCIISDKPEYNLYIKKIKNSMQTVQIHIIDQTLTKLNVYQSIILTYMIELVSCKSYCSITPMDIYNITDFFKDDTKEKQLLKNIENIRDIINQSGINKTHKKVNWNIFKHIRLESDYDYFNICKFQFPIIGNNETDIIHIVLKSNLSPLNFWDTMIEVLLERFMIYNPNSKDVERYENKKINTYIYLLDVNGYINFDWLWDKTLMTDIKVEIKNTMEKYYQNHHNDVYKNFIHTKNKDLQTWKKQPDKVIDLFSQKCKDNKYPEYIIKVFEDINTKIQDDEDYDYIDTFELFNNKLNKKLHIHLKKYLDCD